MDDDIPNPWAGEPEPGPLTPFEKMIFEGPPPPPPHLVELGKRLVGRAKLKFKDFRVDRENIENAAVASAREGDISAKDAQLIFLDTGDVISQPLVERYLERREFALIAKYLKYRIMYQPTGWLTPRNRMALDGMIAGGEPAMAIGLLREFLKKLYQHTQEKWRAAGRKPPKGMSHANTLAGFERSREQALQELPAHLEIAELEMAEIETYLLAHGSREDNRELEKFRDEIAKVRKRFNLPEKRL